MIVDEIKGFVDQSAVVGRFVGSITGAGGAAPAELPVALHAVELRREDACLLLLAESIDDKVGHIVAEYPLCGDGIGHIVAI